MRVATDRSNLVTAALTGVLAIGASAVGAPAAYAEVVQCGADVCASSFSIFLDGSAVEAGGGQFLYDARTGNIVLDTTTNVRGGGMAMNGGLTWDIGGGGSVSVNGVSGNADPILGFSVSTTTGAAGASVAFAFNLPIALTGQIFADSQVAYSLTALSAAGAQISQVGGAIVQAFEVDTTVGGLGALNKGVDVGQTFFVASGPATVTSPTYSATNFFTGDLAYDLMAVRVAYALSPNSAVGVSGFVQQVVVPAPAALPLLFSGLAGLGFLRRRLGGTVNA